jgi:hypothetical protein
MEGRTMVAEAAKSAEPPEGWRDTVEELKREIEALIGLTAVLGRVAEMDDGTYMSSQLDSLVALFQARLGLLEGNVDYLLGEGEKEDAA